MSTEQVDYDTLYDKGFEEGDTLVSTDEQEVEETQPSIEEESEFLEQPTEEEEVETTDEADESTDEATEESNEDSEQKDKYSITINGQNLDLTLDELKTFAQKGGDYTLKTQELADIRGYRDIIKDEGLSKEDLRLIADIKKGNKDAFSLAAKQANLDLYDIDADDESNYKPVVEEVNYALQDAIQAVSSDSENSQVIDGWLNTLPKSVIGDITQDPQILTDLHTETKSGIAQQVMPEVFKTMALNPNVSFKHAYLSAREGVVKQPTQPKPEVSRDIKKKGAIPKATPTRHTSSGKKSYADEYDAIWNGGDEFKKLDAQLKKLRGY